MKTHLRQPSVVQQILEASVAATRCRHAALQTEDAATVEALTRAANRYSGRVEDLAGQLAREAGA
jgi:hypothetical protein